ncbi:hypothetical protein PV328_004386 [Microctonus aethiopoides]|uniref:Uncharacterized protein n=1 Tax=Microctonus aethiopoides TaxID=144406 RepID=A0AA39KLH8_9HYME|nr:hypothetical protein PV328_004386 [Microctonus aethiopoides]
MKLMKPNDNAVKFSKQMSQHFLIHEIRNISLTQNIDEFSTKITSQNFFVLDLDCPQSANILFKANASKLFIGPSKWLILQQLNKEKNLSADNLILQEIFKELQVFPDSEIIIGHRIEDKYFKIRSLYRPSPYRDLVFEDRGSWNDVDHLCLNDELPTSRRRQNLQATPLKSCLVMTDPDTLNHLTDYKDKLVDAVTKANYVWLQLIAERMNVTVNFTLRNTWGYRDKNGTWSGMIGLLDRGEIDIGGTATFPTKDRIGVVDYVQLYSPVGSRFLFRRPSLSYTSNLFILPFDRTVWIAIGVLLILVFGNLYISLKCEWNKIKSNQFRRNLPGELEENPSLSDNFIILIGAVLQQGFNYEPYTISSRIVIFVMLIAALSLYASFTANIVALLQSTSSSINTMQDLMDSGLNFGVQDIVYNRYYFGSFKDPVRYEFYKRFVENKTSVWTTITEGVEQLHKGLYAFHVDTSCGYELIQQTFEENEKCGLHEIDYLKVLEPMLIIKRNSPYREIFRVTAQWIKETGLQDRLIPKLFTEKPICTSHSSFISVGTTESYAAFLVIGYGMAISFGIFFLEIIWNKK